MSSIPASTLNVTDITQAPSASLPICAVMNFNACSMVNVADGLMINVICPDCGDVWQVTIQFNDYTGSGLYDFNGLVYLTMPNHSGCPFGVLSLFLAVHLDSNGLQSCIQRSDAEGASGIPDNWWSVPT